MSTMAIDDICKSKTGEASALILRIADCRVFYQQDGFIKSMGDFEFRDFFMTKESKSE